MTMGVALKEALRNLYEQSWRLALVNVAVALAAAAALLAVAYSRAALVLLVAVGPLVAALMHCAVTLQQTHELRLRDAARGLRLHWRRGLVLGALVVATVVLGAVAVSFWSSHGVAGWPPALVALYLALLFGVFQLHLWPLAVARSGDPLPDVLRAAGVALVRRPFASMALALALLLVNAAGAIGILPLLTFTVSYSALAAAHFALPPPPLEEAIA
jgi:hypothetical protein